MKRAVLPLVALGLLLLVLVDRLSHLRDQSAGGAVRAAPMGAGVATDAPAGASTTDATVSTPGDASAPHTLDRLARLAAREELARQSGLTYLDSLIVSTDSVIRRWPDRTGLPLAVTIIEGGPEAYAPRMANFVRQAFGLWETSGTGLRFVFISDTAEADIVVRWIDRFDFDRAGQTDLTWDQFGRVRKASVSLAVRTSAGLTLPDPALLAVAFHETGHAIGLPHSPDSADVMFPSTRALGLSDRDRRTAQVLYRLPTGTVKEGGR